MENPNGAKEMLVKYVRILTGKSDSQSRRLINKAKEHLGKLPEQVLTISEYCRFRGYDINEVCRLLGLK
jgi:hypothetical protein